MGGVGVKHLLDALETNYTLLTLDTVYICTDVSHRIQSNHIYIVYCYYAYSIYNTLHIHMMELYGCESDPMCHLRVYIAWGQDLASNSGSRPGWSSAGDSRAASQRRLQAPRGGDERCKRYNEWLL